MAETDEKKRTYSQIPHKVRPFLFRFDWNSLNSFRKNITLLVWPEIC